MNEQNTEMNSISDLVNKPVGYDSETGDPIYGSQTNIGDNGTNKQNQAGKKRWVIILVIVAGAICFLAALAFYIFKSGIFMGSKEKVMIAIANTFSETGNLTKDILPKKTINLEHYSVNFDGTLNEDPYKASLAITPEVQQLYLYDPTDTPEDYICALELTNREITLSSSELNKQFVYRYTEEPGKDLTEVFGRENIETFNEILTKLNSTLGHTTVAEYTEDAILAKDTKQKALNQLFGDDLEKILNKSYVIDGKTRSCTGYQTTFSQENPSVFDQTAEENELGRILTITYYLYKGKLACMEIVTETGEDIEIEFRGGNYPSENLAIVTNDVTMLEVRGSADENLEERECFLNGMSIFQTEYNIDTKQLHLDANYSIGLTMDITILPCEDGFAFEVENMHSLYTDTTINGKFHVNNQVELIELTKEECDISKDLSMELNLLKELLDSGIADSVQLYD